MNIWIRDIWMYIMCLNIPYTYIYITESKVNKLLLRILSWVGSSIFFSGESRGANLASPERMRGILVTGEGEGGGEMLNSV